MAPCKPIKTYQKKEKGAVGNVSKSVQAINALFAQNLTKRMLGRKKKKPKLKLKELPPRTEPYLSDDSLHVKSEDTFDRLLKGKVYNKVDLKEENVKINSSTSDTSKSKVAQISASFNSPVMTRHRRKKIPVVSNVKSPKASVKSPRKLRARNNTLDRSVNISLCVEKENKQTNFSSLSYIKLPKITEHQVTSPTSSRMEASFEPIFSDTFREQQAVHSSTPFVAPKKKIVTDKISPISKITPATSPNLIRKSYEEIKKWDLSFPVEEGQQNVVVGRKSRRRKLLNILDVDKTEKDLDVDGKAEDYKLNLSPRVYIKSPDIINVEKKLTGNINKGFSLEEQRSSRVLSDAFKEIVADNILQVTPINSLIEEFHEEMGESSFSVEQSIQGVRKNTRRQELLNVNAKDWKLNFSPKVYIGASDIVAVNKNKGFSFDEQKSSQEFSDTLRDLCEKVSNKLNHEINNLKNHEREKPKKSAKSLRKSRIVYKRHLRSSTKRSASQQSKKSNNADLWKVSSSDDIKTENLGMEIGQSDNIRKSVRERSSNHRVKNNQKLLRSSSSGPTISENQCVTRRRGRTNCVVHNFEPRMKESVNITNDILSEKEISYVDHSIVESKPASVISISDEDLNLGQAERSQMSLTRPQGTSRITANLQDFNSFVEIYYESSQSQDIRTGKSEVSSSSDKNSGPVKKVKVGSSYGSVDLFDSIEEVSSIDNKVSCTISDSDTKKQTESVDFEDIIEGNLNCRFKESLKGSSQFKTKNSTRKSGDVTKSVDFENSGQNENSDYKPSSSQLKSNRCVSQEIDDITGDVQLRTKKSEVEVHKVFKTYQNIWHDHSYSNSPVPDRTRKRYSEKSPNKSKSLGAARKCIMFDTSPTKNDAHDTFDVSDIIESSNISENTVPDMLNVKKDKFLKVYESKRFTLKPGKLYRRSLLLIKKSSMVLAETEKKLCAKDCICIKCILHNKINQDNSRRSSQQIVPTLDGDNHNTSLLETYARSRSSYAQKQQFIDISLDDSVRNLSISNSRNSSHQLQTNCLPIVTAKDIVLRRCGQTEPLSFLDCYPSSALKNCHKIGEGVYGEVFLYQNQNGGTSVMKIIPIEGDLIVNGEKQKKYDEILSEIVITMELSNLRQNIKNCTSSFVEVQKVRCVQGCYPDRLLDLWDLYDENKGSENDSPCMFKADQLYIILELSNGGQDLESYVFNNAQQVFSTFKQTACALAIAESQLKFEHRDLHWGNVLLKTVERNKAVHFCLDGEEIKIPAYGIEATIIDFTLSRMEFDGVVIFNDLSLDNELFTSTGDYQFEIYRLMQKSNGNEWQHFQPYSNILWLHYFLDKVTEFRYKNSNSKIHKEHIGKLKKIKEEILSFSSTVEFVKSHFSANN